jgi:CIC family chloride channel protein
VEDGGRLIGLFTFNDLKRAIAGGQSRLSLTALSSPSLVYVYPDHMLDIALLKLGRNSISQLPVVSRRDRSRLLGIITMHDIAEALSKSDERTEITKSPEAAAHPINSQMNSHD